jgi:pilus assembly protein CpaC
MRNSGGKWPARGVRLTPWPVVVSVGIVSVTGVSALAQTAPKSASAKVPTSAGAKAKTAKAVGATPSKPALIREADGPLPVKAGSPATHTAVKAKVWPKAPGALVAGVTGKAVRTAAITLPPRRGAKVALASGENLAVGYPQVGPAHGSRGNRLQWKRPEWAAPGSGTIPRVLRTVRVGESQVLDFVAMSRAAIGNPSVADVAVLTGDQLLVNGKSPGETTLFVWDRRGQTRCDITVVADTTSPATVVDRVRHDINDPSITVRPIGDTLFLEGEVAHDTAAMRAEAIASAYTRNVKNLIRVEAPAPTAPSVRTASMAKDEMERALTGIPVAMRVVNDNTVLIEGSVTPDVAERVRKVTSTLGSGVQVLDMLAVGRPQQKQLMVRCRMVEINKQRTKDLGLEWGRVQFNNDANGTTSASVVDPPFLIGQTNLSPGGLLRGGALAMLDPLGVRVNSLLSQNAGRLLAEPNMCVMEGQRTSMLVGGEIPVPIAQSSGFGSAVSVAWKPFGVQIYVEPTAIEGDQITMKIAPEVSTLDYGNAVRANGITIPALRSRRCEGIMRVRNGQTIALGGLLMNEDTAGVRHMPLLSKLPVIGNLFKSREFIRGDTELIMLMTPEIMEPGNTPVPTVNIQPRRPEFDGKTLTTGPAGPTQTPTASAPNGEKSKERTEKASGD